MILDFSLDNRTVLTDPLDCAIQELDMMFNTTNTELIGKTDYGTNFEQFLWTLTPMIESLKNYISEKLGEMLFVPLYNPTIDITTEPGQTREIYVVMITLNIETDDEELLKKSRRVYMLQ